MSDSEEPKPYPWAEQLHNRIAETFGNLKKDIEIKVKRLIEKSYLGIPEERSIITRFYSDYYNDFIQKIIEPGVRANTIFSERIKSELIPDNQYLISNDRINYFFEEKFESFWTELVLEYERIE